MSKAAVPSTTWCPMPLPDTAAPARPPAPRPDNDETPGRIILDREFWEPKRVVRGTTLRWVVNETL